MRRTRDRANLKRLWEACQTPDFRKTTQEEHMRLIGGLFEHLTQGDRRVPEDWMQGQFSTLDRTDGDIDALQSRLARVRTLAYIANRSSWLADPAGWQARARGLEDRLSDTLHQSLMNGSSTGAPARCCGRCISTQVPCSAASPPTAK